jgi:hypothetical protein
LHFLSLCRCHCHSSLKNLCPQDENILNTCCGGETEIVPGFLMREGMGELCNARDNSSIYKALVKCYQRSKRVFPSYHSVPVQSVFGLVMNALVIWRESDKA